MSEYIVSTPVALELTYTMRSRSWRVHCGYNYINIYGELTKLRIKEFQNVPAKNFILAVIAI